MLVPVSCMHGEGHVSHVACLQSCFFQPWESVLGGATVNRDPKKSKGIGLKSQLSLEYESQLFNHQTRGVFNASLSASSWKLAKKHPWNLDFATAVPPTERSEIHLSYKRKGSHPMKSSLVRRDSHFRIFQGNVIIPKYNPEIRIHPFCSSFPFFSSIPFAQPRQLAKQKCPTDFHQDGARKTNYSWRRVTTQQRTMKCQRSPEDPLFSQSNGCLLVRVQSDSQHTTLETLTVNLDKFRQDSLICPLWLLIIISSPWKLMFKNLPIQGLSLSLITNPVRLRMAQNYWHRPLNHFTRSMLENSRGVDNQIISPTFRRTELRQFWFKKTELQHPVLNVQEGYLGSFSKDLWTTWAHSPVFLDVLGFPCRSLQVFCHCSCWHRCSCGNSRCSLITAAMAEQNHRWFRRFLEVKVLFRRPSQDGIKFIKEA